MGIFQKIISAIANASMPIYKFENNQIAFKTESEEYIKYDLDVYDVKTRHDPFVVEAYTINNDEIFLEYVKTDTNIIWNGQALSLYEDFFKQKLQIKEFETLESKDISNYTFKVKKVDDSFILHIIYIWAANTDVFILDMKGDLYKKLLSEFEKGYSYKYDNEEKAHVNFNISLVKENCMQGFFNVSH